jgi:hypothetical protein
MKLSFAQFCFIREIVATNLGWKEGEALPDLSEIYPGVVFKNKSEWEAGNKEVNEGLTKMRATMVEQKESIKEQRIKSGTEARFSKLKSKEFVSVNGGTNSSKVH